MKILSLLPIAVTLAGTYLLFKLRFFFLFNPQKTLKKAMRAVGGKDSFSSLSLALAGTLGIGNIVGVAVGISVGGPGSVFWLFISSVFAMVIKYCEATISSDMGEGLGMIGVLRKSFAGKKRAISYVYASLVLILSFIMGAALQSRSIAQTAEEAFKISPLFSAFAVTVFILYPVFKGNEKIEKITAIIIPLATVVYILLAFSSIITNISKLPSAFTSVVSSAFYIKSVKGGILGFLLSNAVKEGYLRGILSNEAGAGTSSFAHARNGSRDPSEVGVMGIAEVFFDTVLLCMLTAFATLVSTDGVLGLSGVGIIIIGIGSVFGMFSEYLLFLCIFAFAYSTVICWYYYGRCAYAYLFGRCGTAYAVSFCASVLLGALIETRSLIAATDITLLLLSFISLFAVIKNSDRIKLLSEKGGLVIPKARCREKPTSIRRKYSREDRP